MKIFATAMAHVHGEKSSNGETHIFQGPRDLLIRSASEHLSAGYESLAGQIWENLRLKDGGLVASKIAEAWLLSSIDVARIMALKSSCALIADRHLADLYLDEYPLEQELGEGPNNTWRLVITVGVPLLRRNDAALELLRRVMLPMSPEQHHDLVGLVDRYLCYLRFLRKPPQDAEVMDLLERLRKHAYAIEILERWHEFTCDEKLEKLAWTYVDIEKFLKEIEEEKNE